MKTLILLSSLFLITACNDALRTRPGKCMSASNRFIECGKTYEAIKKDEYRYMYIAEVTTDISIGKTQLILHDNVSHSDEDNVYICEISTGANKTFSYSLSKGNLILKDGMNSLIFSKANGGNSDSLIATWKMETITQKEKITTELIFLNKDELRIRKTCHVKE